MQQVRFINNQLILNMFRAYLRPSSGGRTALYGLWFPVIVVMMLESRIVRCVHCDEDVAWRSRKLCQYRVLLIIKEVCSSDISLAFMCIGLHIYLIKISLALLQLEVCVKTNRRKLRRQNCDSVSTFPHSTPPPPRPLPPPTPHNICEAVAPHVAARCFRLRLGGHSFFAGDLTSGYSHFATPFSTFHRLPCQIIPYLEKYFRDSAWRWLKKAETFSWKL
jgi:hypothetical protein